MDDLSDLKLAGPKPTPLRPLLGLTVLIVEDSRFASEALRLLCLRSGARIRRADCLSSARRHLQTYRPSVAIVDIGLPDGSGLELIETLTHATQRPDVILATSGQNRSDAEQSAQDAGADGFLPKPIESLAAFQQAILHHLPNDMRPNGPRMLSAEIVTPDPFAMNEDLCHIAKLMDTGEADDTFVAGFLTGIARTAHDEVLLREAETLTTASGNRAKIRALIAARLQERRAV